MGSNLFPKFSNLFSFNCGPGVHFTLLLLTYLICRIGYLWYASSGFMDWSFIATGGDAGHFLEIAENIKTHGVFSDSNSEIPSQRAVWRPPLWPFLLSIFMFFSESYSGLLFAKLLCELVLIFLAFSGLSKLGFDRIILWALAILLPLEPQWLKYSFTFLSESIAAALILLAAVFFIRGIKLRDWIICALLLGMAIMAHPVSIVFGAAVAGSIFLINRKQRLFFRLIPLLIFGIVVLAWPVRNEYVFGQGLFMTTSQGPTFSKGWNEMVLEEFTNSRGDLASHGLNLKYLDSDEADRFSRAGFIERSKWYQVATMRFIANQSFFDLMRIGLKKLKSNFTPYPEESKPGFLEQSGTFFRTVYLFLFVQVSWLLITGKITKKQTVEKRTIYIVAAIIVGQAIMSLYIYTGLRFNSVYGPALLMCAILINKSHLQLFITGIRRRIYHSGK